jgi:hypothetical protein
MKRLFIQTSIFSKRLDEQGVPNLLELIEEEILDNPQAGDVVPGSGGVRKLRVADSGRGKGKRGGLRVLFLDLPDRELTYLIYFYGKGESENLSAEQKRQISYLVKILKEA